MRAPNTDPEGLRPVSTARLFLRPQRAIVALLALALLLTSIVPVTRTSAARGDSPAPYDLAALGPGVFDLEAAGLENLRAEAPFDTDRVELAWDPVTATQLDTTADDLDRFGMVRHYSVWWSDNAHLEESGALEDLESLYLSRLDLSITQFATADDAADAWDTFSEPLTQMDDVEVPGADDSIVAGQDVLDPLTDTDYSGTIVAARDGDVIMSTMVLTTRGSDVRGDETEIALELGTDFMDRAEDRDDIEPGTLGMDAVRFDHEDLIPIASNYMLLDGEMFWHFAAETTEERDAEAELMLAFDAIDTYQLTQRFDTDERYYFRVTSARFTDEDAARLYFETIEESWDDESWSAEPIRGAPDMGDESFAARGIEPDGPRHYLTFGWVDGDRYHEIQIQVLDRFASDEALFAIIDEQSDCQAAGDCWRMRDMPDEVVDDATVSSGR